MATNKKDAFSDLSLSGMTKYNERNAEAQRLKRAAELDDRIRAFASRVKDAKWISEAEEFCRGEELANKDVFDLSKEAYRLPFIIDEARGLAKLAEEESLAKIEAESRAKQAKLEAEAKEKELRAKLAKNERDRVNRESAKVFDERISALAKAARTEHWCDEVEKANTDAKALATDVKLLVKGIAKLDAMLSEVKKIKADKAEAIKKKAEADARAKAEHEAALAKIEDEKRIAKAKAEAEEARIKAEREKEAAKEKAAREAALEKIENEKRVAKAKAEAEEARIKAEREREAAKEKAAREAEAERIEGEKRIAKEKADAEAARIRAEKEAQEREAARLRADAENKARLARIEAEAKEKALRERLGKEEADRRDRESAADMDDLVSKLSKAPRTKLWITEVKKAYANAEAMTTDAKLMVAGLDTLEEMFLEANAREKAKELDKKIDSLHHTPVSADWARSVLEINGRINGTEGVRDAACVAAKVYMEKLQLLPEMVAKTGAVLDDEARAVAEREKAEKKALAKSERVRRRREAIKKVGDGVVVGAKLIAKIILVVAVIAAGALASALMPDQLEWTVPATLAVLLFTLRRMIRNEKFEKFSMITDVLSAVASIVFIIIGGDLALSAIVLGANLLLAPIVHGAVDAWVERKFPGTKKGKKIYKNKCSVKALHGDAFSIWSVVMTVIGGCIATFAVAFGVSAISGDGIYITIGIGLGVTMAAMVSASRVYDEKSVCSVLSAAVPAVSAILVFTAKRPLVFGAFAVSTGLFLAHLIWLVIDGVSGNLSLDFTDLSRELGGLLSGIVCLLATFLFFFYVGYTDFIIDENGVLKKCYSREEVLIIPEGVTEIDDDALNMFVHNVNAIQGYVKKIVIPESVTRIGENAFFWNFGVEEIYLPKSLKKIEGDSMLRGSNSSEITVYYSGSKGMNDRFEDSICPISGSSNFIEELVSVIPTKCRSVEWVYDYEYTEDFYGE